MWKFPGSRFRRALGWVGLAMMVALVPVQAGGAQEYDVAFQTQEWGQEALRRFHGVLLRVGWSNGAELSLDAGGAGWDDRGTTCGGFIEDPSDCIEESRNIGSQTAAFLIGFRILDWSTEGGLLSLVPTVGIAAAQLSVLGAETGGRLEDSQILLEVGLGLRYRSPRFLGDHVRIFGEYRRSYGRDVSPACGDCYNVLHDGTTRRSVVMGMGLSGSQSQRRNGN